MEKLQKEVLEANKHEVERGKIESELNNLKTEYITVKEKIDDINQINNSNNELKTKNLEIEKDLEYQGLEKKSLSDKIESFNKQLNEVKRKIEISNQKRDSLVLPLQP